MPLVMMVRMISAISGIRRALATGMDRRYVVWYKNVPIRALATVAFLGLAPPMTMAETAGKLIINGPSYRCRTVSYTHLVQVRILFLQLQLDVVGVVFVDIKDN